MFSQNAGNAISETQILKIFRGSMPPDHPRNLAPSALVSPLVSTPQKKLCWIHHWALIEPYGLNKAL